MTIEGKRKMNEEEMAEGYQALAEENKEFAEMAAGISNHIWTIEEIVSLVGQNNDNRL